MPILNTLGGNSSNISRMKREFSKKGLRKSLRIKIINYCFFSTKPHVNFDYEIPPPDGQLVIWQ